MKLVGTEGGVLSMSLGVFAFPRHIKMCVMRSIRNKWCSLLWGMGGKPEES